MSTRDRLSRLHNLVKQHLNMHAHSHRRPALEKAIREEIKSLADEHIDIETLTEEDFARTEHNILHALNPTLTEAQRKGPRLQLRPQPPRDVIALELAKLNTLGAVPSAKKVMAGITLALEEMKKHGVDAEDLEMLRNLPQAVKDRAAKMYYMMRDMDPQKRLPINAPQEDIYSAGVRISRLVLDNADNYAAVPKLGPGLGGPLGRGPAGKILEIIPDIIYSMQLQENLENRMRGQQPLQEPKPFHPTPFPDLSKIPGTE